jgi:nucleoside phosphorylase
MTIVEEHDDFDWLGQLADRIKYVARSVRARQRSISQQYDYDVLVFSALDKELRPFRDLHQTTPSLDVPDGHQFIFADAQGHPRKGIAFSVGHAGQAAAAASAAGLLAQCRPKLCLMIGVCGGVEGQVAEGDVILFENVFNWDCGKWREPAKGRAAVFEARPDPIGIGHGEARRIARELVEEGMPEGAAENGATLSDGRITSPEIVLSPAASGSAVVGHKAVMSKIRLLSGSIKAVDMESYGFYYACRRTLVVRPDYLCIKSVADFSDGNKGDSLHTACSQLSATLASEIITRRWAF